MSIHHADPRSAGAWQRRCSDVLTLVALMLLAQPRYKYDPQTGRWRMLDPKKVAEWIRDGLYDLLLGTLVPDVVIHESGNPDKVQRVYDYKFPCLPNSMDGLRWRSYPKGHPHYPHNQGQKYKDALLPGDQRPSFVSPQLGVTQ
jgi:hypothetical protein